MAQKKICLYGYGENLKKNFNTICSILGESPYAVVDQKFKKKSQKIDGIFYTNFDGLLQMSKNLDIKIYITIQNYQSVLDAINLHKISSDINIILFKKNFFNVDKIFKIEKLIKLKKVNEIQKQNLNNKTLLITGGSRGIGKAIVGNLLKKNLNVISISNNIDNIKQIKSEFAQFISNKKLSLIQCDLNNSKDVHKTISFIDKKYSKIDYLINNAAYSPPSNNDFENLNLKNYIDTYQINFLSAIEFIFCCIKKMEKNKFGVILNITTNMTENINSLAYSSSKIALDKFAYDIHKELENKNIKIFNINPGTVDTDMSRSENNKSQIDSIFPGIILPIEYSLPNNKIFYDSNIFSNLDGDEAYQKFLKYYE